MPCRIRLIFGLKALPDGAAPPAAVQQRGRAARAEQARIDIHFEQGVPVSVNGVPMAPAELVESLGLIAGWHGIGRIEMDGGGRRVVYDAPAAVVLRAALASGADEGGIVRLALLNGEYTVLAPDAANLRV